MYKKLSRIVGCLVGVRFPTFPLRDVKCEYFVKGTKICRFLGNLWDKERENLVDHGFRKIRDHGEADDQSWVCSIYPFRQKTTLHYAEFTAIFLVTGYCGI